MSCRHFIKHNNRGALFDFNLNICNFFNSLIFLMIYEITLHFYFIHKNIVQFIFIKMSLDFSIFSRIHKTLFDYIVNDGLSDGRFSYWRCYNCEVGGRMCSALTATASIHNASSSACQECDAFTSAFPCTRKPQMSSALLQPSAM